MAGDVEWELADTIGDRAQDWNGVTNTVYGQRRSPDDPAVTTIIRGGRRYQITVTVTDLDS